MSLIQGYSLIYYYAPDEYASLDIYFQMYAPIFNGYATFF